MRTGIRVARIVQIVGMVLIVAGIVKCSDGAANGYATTFGAGLALILGARIYEWLVKE